jgi:nicotinamidase-related amidase
MPKWKDDDLIYGPLGAECRHLCVDMQRMFYDDTPWRTPWMERIAPQARRLTATAPQKTVFTRFIPLARPEGSAGSGRRFYERWPEMTTERLGAAPLGLIPELVEFAPPALVVDKQAYSPWFRTGLHARLQAEKVEALIVSGGETDVCVLSAILGAVDYGYRVVLARDALCSSSDQTHDAILALFETRYSEQVEAAETETILENWRPRG